jgi:hypothetical protein
MQKFHLILAGILLISCCKKDTASQVFQHEGDQGIVGKWKLSDSYASPGGFVDINAVPWIPITPDIYFLEFKSNGDFYNSSDPNFIPDHYIINDSTILINRGNKQMMLGYKIKPPYLEIYGNMSFDAFCTEFCGTRYISEN